MQLRLTKVELPVTEIKLHSYRDEKLTAIVTTKISMNRPLITTLNTFSINTYDN